MSFVSSRLAVHPGHFQAMTTQTIREHFLIDNIFVAGTVQQTYTHYDRLIVGGAMPIHQALRLETFNELKAEYYLQRRELGIINVGAPGVVKADGNSYTLGNKEALYLGRGLKDITFESSVGGQSLFYFNSAPAHTTHPTKKVSSSEAETIELGSLATSNHRTIRKLLVNSVLTTCQLQMGLTELKPGSVWNTMPPHTHTRRMEAYFYFDLTDGQAVCHHLGQSNETRHIWLKNQQAVLSPPWSVHCGAGTSNYSFIWGMAGENLDYGDMEAVTIPDLR
jgi:4-deoxy-L-threo-5-hexosulose-uronate ketol-isomerase